MALALAGAVSATTMNQDDYKFMKYIVEHNKEYNTLEEFNMRRSNFLFMDAEISKLNTMANATSVHGHNYLSDYTRAEYQNLLGLKNMPKPDRTNRPKLEAANVVGLPTSVNWVTAGKVNAIKDQGKCGSDWAFSANAALESANAIFNGPYQACLNSSSSLAQARSVTKVATVVGTTTPGTTPSIIQSPRIPPTHTSRAISVLPTAASMLLAQALSMVKTKATSLSTLPQ